VYTELIEWDTNGQVVDKQYMNFVNKCAKIKKFWVIRIQLWEVEINVYFIDVT